MHEGTSGKDSNISKWAMLQPHIEGLPLLKFLFKAEENPNYPVET